MRIAFVPIDNRPVCYQLPKMIADTNPDVEFFIPPKEFLGDLTNYANVKELANWLENLDSVDAIILPLDTIAYGGLIPSRRCSDTFEDIKYRLQSLKSILKSKQARIYAFSSVMRISNNNINQEEKEYWNLYGEKIFRYSYDLHKLGYAQTTVPDEILEDYIATRQRNFEINKLYLEWQKEGFFDTLIFSKDDCAEFGLNVMEAQELEKLGGFVKTGADEIPLTLLARALDNKIKVAVRFSEPDEKHLISNYEDISIEKSTLSQLELGGCEVTDEQSADVILYVNNFKGHQGEIVMKRDTVPFDGEFKVPDNPYVVADVRYANGSDNAFVKQLFDIDLGENFLGYSAWNTSANSLGSLICAMKFAYKNNKSEEFLKLQAVRFLDDWAYQANVRQQLNSPDIYALNCKMADYENVVKKVLGIEFSAKYSFPWNRLFEVEIELS